MVSVMVICSIVFAYLHSPTCAGAGGGAGGGGGGVQILLVVSQSTFVLIINQSVI